MTGAYTLYTLGKVVKDVLVAACAQKAAWDGFTKPQRKSINQWKDAVTVSTYIMCIHIHTHQNHLHEDTNGNT